MVSVLILDDDADLTMTWRQALGEAGHRVTVCHDSITATNLLSIGTFETIIVDFTIKDCGQVLENGFAYDAVAKPNMILICGGLDGAIPAHVEQFILKYLNCAILRKPVELDQLINAVGA